MKYKYYKDTKLYMPKEAQKLVLIPFSHEEIFNYMSTLDRPVMETELIRKFTNIKYLPGNNSKLFELHFSLFHALYEIKHEYAREGYYFHPDCMRLRIIKIPHIDTCHHYFSENGKFCSKKAITNGFCMEHFDICYTYNNPILDPLDCFYRNPENIEFGNEEILGKLMKGVFTYAFRKGELTKAKKFFNLNKPGPKSIKKRYYELAKIYHSDKNTIGDQKMKELNYYYDLLNAVFIL